MMKVKDKTLSVRMTEEDYKYINQEAKEQEVTMGEYIRILIKKNKEESK